MWLIMIVLMLRRYVEVAHDLVLFCNLHTIFKTNYSFFVCENPLVTKIVY
jgi:hypothetical protein